MEFRENFEPARRLLPLALSWLTCGKSTAEVDEKKMTRQLYRVRFPVYKNIITCIFLFHRRVLRDK